MQRRFYNRRAINTVARVLPPQEAEKKYSTVHNMPDIEDTPLSTVLLLVAISQLTKDRNDVSFPTVLERLTPYLDGPQKLQINSLINLSKMSESMHSMKKSGGHNKHSNDPMKNIELIRALSEVANPHSQPVLKNIGDVYAKGQTMKRSLKRMQSLRSKKGGAPIGEMIDAMSSIMPQGSPLSSMGGVIKAAQMVGNMGGLAGLKGSAKGKPDNDDILGDDEDDDQ